MLVFAFLELKYKYTQTHKYTQIHEGSCTLLFAFLAMSAQLD